MELLYDDLISYLFAFLDLQSLTRIGLTTFHWYQLSLNLKHYQVLYDLQNHNLLSALKSNYGQYIKGLTSHFRLKDLARYDPFALQICEWSIRANAINLVWLPEVCQIPAMYKIGLQCHRNMITVSYIPEVKLTLDLCKLAVENYGRCFQMLPNDYQTADVARLAVLHDGLALNQIGQCTPHHMTLELCQLAVQNTGLALQFVPDRLKSCVFEGRRIYEWAICQNIMALQYMDPCDLSLVDVDKRCFELCYIAVLKDFRSYELVPDQYKSWTLYGIMIRGWISSIQKLIPKLYYDTNVVQFSKFPYTVRKFSRSLYKVFLSSDRMMTQNWTLWASIGGLIACVAFHAIVIPILVCRFESMFFLIALTAIQLLIIFFIAFSYRTRFKMSMSGCKLLILSGFFLSLCTICTTYSAHPERTPILLQAIFLYFTIVFSMVLRRLLIDRNSIYRKIYIIPSLLLFGTSLVLPITYMAHELHWSNLGWCLVFLLGIISLSMFNVIQEKYFTQYDNSLNNKIGSVFYMQLVNTILILSLFWLDTYIGYNQNPVTAFLHSLDRFIGEWISTILLEMFILITVVMFVLGTYINTISTNYNMIANITANPIIVIFFSIFPSLNSGIQYPIYISLICVICSIFGLFLWLRGEVPNPQVQDIQSSETRSSVSETRNSVSESRDPIFETEALVSDYHSMDV